MTERQIDRLYREAVANQKTSDYDPATQFGPHTQDPLHENQHQVMQHLEDNGGWNAGEAPGYGMSNDQWMGIMKGLEDSGHVHKGVGNGGWSYSINPDSTSENNIVNPNTGHPYGW